MKTRWFWLTSVAMWLTPHLANADVSVSLRGGYIFDDSANELTDQFTADAVVPQSSGLGLGVVYSVPDSERLHDWSIAVGGIWGRGNEQYRDLSISREEGEVVIQRTVSGVFSAFLGYRYEHMAAETIGAGRVIQPSQGLPITQPADLILADESLLRHSVRIGASADVSTGRNAATSQSHWVSSFAGVFARSRNVSTFDLDIDPGPGVAAREYRVEEDGEWRFGPELQAGYRWVANEHTAVELRYRGTFLFDRFGSAADISASHGLTLSVGYRFGSD